MYDPVGAHHQRHRADAAELEALVEAIIEPLLAHQRGRVLSQAQSIDPRLCADDVLQPDDYPALCRDPRWNYEDGVLAGMHAVQMALRSALRRLSGPGPVIHPPAPREG